MCAGNVVSQAAGMQIQDVQYFISQDMYPQLISMVVDATLPECPLNFELAFYNVYT